MDHSTTFARLFARLVWLLIHDGDNVDEQKMSLRAAVSIGKQGAVRLRAAPSGLYADGEPMPLVLSGVLDVAERMRAGRLAEIEFERQPAAGEMLGLARALAQSDPEHADADALHDRLAELGATTLRFVRASEGDAAAPVAGFEPTRTVSDEVPPPHVPEESDAQASETGAPAVPPEAAPEPPRASVQGLVSQDAGGMFFQFSSIGNVKDSPEALLDRLRESREPGETIRLLDDVVTLAETAAREGKPLVVADLLQGVIEREAFAPEGDEKRAYVMALRRLAKPLLLRAVASQLTAAPERRGDLVTALARMGQDGAEAVIEQVTQAPTAEARRELVDVLTALSATVPALAHMLGDARWFVARNAADLLGELKAAEAEGALVKLLRHDDERVRRAATNALMQLGSDSARQAVREAVRDDSPQVRMQAAFAIAAHRDPKTATTLITAIDAEQDSDVQLAMLLALGRVGTSEAVERLIRAAEPERGFFRKKSTAFRVAAVQALAEVRTPAAQAALKALASDKDKEVRDTVARLSRKDRRTSGLSSAP
ncbi:MAG: HEAT repeat domain-containing protein [Gemmatimonadota bacterium]|nr:HEAT repeat domain-containing protein [Gemmatimonadota bacterium]